MYDVIEWYCVDETVVEGQYKLESLKVMVYVVLK